jgi:hypothetical protein
MILALDSSTNQTAKRLPGQTGKRLPDPTLSSRAFAIFFIVTILIVIMLLLAPKAGATNRNWQNTSINFNTGANWCGGQVPGSADMAPTKTSGTQSFILKTLQNQSSKPLSRFYYYE